MKLIGEIENVSNNGLWIVRSEMAPKIGSNIYNQQKKMVGRLVNIIGPVKKPFLLVKPIKREHETKLQVIGEKLYIMDEVTGIKRN